MKTKVLSIYSSCNSLDGFSTDIELMSVDLSSFYKGGDLDSLPLREIKCFNPDLIVCQPSCKAYSVASCFHHRKTGEEISEYAKISDQILEILLFTISEMLDSNNSLVYFIENPRGMLRKMPFMDGIPRYTLWYCQYGENRAKPTDIWTNSFLFAPRKECFNGNLECHHQSSPRGSRKGTQAIKSTEEKARIPRLLISEILSEFVGEK